MRAHVMPMAEEVPRLAERFTGLVVRMSVDRQMQVGHKRHKHKREWGSAFVPKSRGMAHVLAGHPVL